jgi:hypothetical protein
MAITQKISVAMGRTELRLAKTAAAEEGISLSAYVTRAVRSTLEERRRIEAAKQLLGAFDPAELPSAEEQRELIAIWTRQHEPATPVKRRAANGNRRTRRP